MEIGAAATLMFEIKEKINLRSVRSGGLVVTSLFWSQPYSRSKRISKITISSLLLANRFIYGKVYSPWTMYLMPLLEAANAIRRSREDLTFRVYLAEELAFLLPDLTKAGCEIFVMSEPSVAHNPGAMWRFLAMEEGERGVTIIDADRGQKVLADVARTDILMGCGLGVWRIPYEFGINYAHHGVEGYRPINASQFGVARSYPTRDLMEDFIASSKKGELPSTVKVRDGRIYPIGGTRWPDYGFDEWFLQASLYRIMAEDGILTFTPSDIRPFSQFLALDIEFATRSNPASEVILFDTVKPTKARTGLRATRMRGRKIHTIEGTKAGKKPFSVRARHRIKRKSR